MRALLLPIALLLVGGCAAPGATHAPGRPVDAVLGLYQGTFDSALTEDPADDLNHNPCDPGDGDACATHQQPLVDVLLELHRDADGRLRLTFYRDRQGRRRGHALDLLGVGCGTQLGPAEDVARDDGGRWTASFPLTTDNRLCLGKLRPTSRHAVRVEVESGAAAASGARVVIDRRVEDTNYLYVVEDGVERRVRIDLENTLETGDRARYRVCIENDLGEYERCVLTDRKFRSFALPVPVPGGAAVNYTWWHELSPRLHSTRGRYTVHRYIGRFERIEP